MGNSLLRKETSTAKPGTFCPDGGTAYLTILKAVESQAGLIHGKLDGPYGEHCAIGSYFDVHPKAALPSTLIDEVAFVNDSIPNGTAKQRKSLVIRWLRWRLAQLGMPGFERTKAPAK